MKYKKELLLEYQGPLKDRKTEMVVMTMAIE